MPRTDASHDAQRATTRARPLPQPSFTVERCWQPDPERQVAALLVLLAHRAVDVAVEADLVAVAARSVPPQEEVPAD